MYIASEPVSVSGTGFGDLAIDPDDQLYVAYTSGAGFDFQVESFTSAGVFTAKRQIALDLVTNGVDQVTDIAVCGNSVVVVGSAETTNASDAAIAVLSTSAITCLGGDFLAAGKSASGLFDTFGLLARFTSTGALNSSFGQQGVSLYQYAPPPIRSSGERGAPLAFPTEFSAALVDSQGRLFVAASVIDFFGQELAYLLSLSALGQPTAAFGDLGWAQADLVFLAPTPVNVLQGPADTILLVGHFEGTTIRSSAGPVGTDFSGPFLARFLATTGAPDTRFLSSGVAAYDFFDTQYATAAASSGPDDKVVLVSDFIPLADRQVTVLRFKGDVFSDGFEFGSTLFWSSTTP